MKTVTTILKNTGRGRPTVQMPPLEVCINPVAEDADQETIEKGGNFPTLPRVI